MFVLHSIVSFVQDLLFCCCGQQQNNKLKTRPYLLFKVGFKAALGVRREIENAPIKIKRKNKINRLPSLTRTITYRTLTSVFERRLGCVALRIVCVECYGRDEREVEL